MFTQSPSATTADTPPASADAAAPAPAPRSKPHPPRVAGWLTVDTPDGPFTVVTDTPDEGAAVLASGWTTEPEYLLTLVHRSLRPYDLEETSAPPIADAVGAYYQGDFDAVAAIPVIQRGGPFIQRAWAALRTLRPGHPVSYTELAVLTGDGAAIRAAASACARNAASLFVPCHRVRRGDGTLGGYRYGLDLKAALLEREAS